MNGLLSILLLLVPLAGCSERGGPTATAPAAAGKGAASGASQSIAYEHSVSIEAEEQKIAQIFEAAQTACREAAADSCVILESQINTGGSASASLKFRAKPSGIQKLRAALSLQGSITSQSTTAEDLASPIEDTSKKLVMLSTYRSKLEGLLGRANNDVDSLIKLNRELAQVQSEFEAATGTRAHLVRRVETEILKVSVRSIRDESFWRSIAAAISSFGMDLSRGISYTITAVAYLLPWSIALLVAVWAGRKLWHRRKRSGA